MLTLADVVRWAERTFWRRSIHRQTSSGAVHAALPVVLDATGKLDATLLDLTNYLRRSGVDTLIGDWDIGAGRKISGDKLAARSASGLRLEDDGGNLGIFVADGGDIGIRHTGLTQYISLLIGERRANDNYASLVLSPSATANRGWALDVYDPDTTAQFFQIYDRLNAVARLIIDNAGKIGLGRIPTGETLEIGPNSSGYATCLSIANGNYGAGLAVTTNNGTNTWFIGARKDATGGSAGTDRINILYGTNLLVYLSTTGLLGLGIEPQGKLHVHDGTMGDLRVSKTGIDGTPQTIIPNGSGDMVRGGKIIGYAYDGTASYVIDTSVANGGVSASIGAGGETIQFACAADGALTVSRNAGTRTWSIGIAIVWL